MIIACLELVFSLGLDHLQNAKNLENVHMKRKDNKSCVRYNYDKKLMLLNFGEEVVKGIFYGMWFWRHVFWVFSSHLPN